MDVSYDSLFGYMAKHNISKRKLAEKTGISRNTIIKMANGEAVHLSVILAICEAYDLEIEDVVRLKK